MPPNRQPKQQSAELNRWRSLIPVLYDWFCHHHLIWPSLSCRWGAKLEDQKFKTKQRLYLSEQTDGSVPNTLVLATVEVVKPRVAASDHINSFKQETRSPFVKKTKTIIHPGEVNRIREFSQEKHIVATHSDIPEVFIWNVDRQPSRSVKEEKSKGTSSKPSIADLVLKGHSDIAEFALATCQVAPCVVSGGRDTNVLLWNLEDQMTSLQAPAHSPASAAPSTDPSPTTLLPRCSFSGHSSTVEDVQFLPSSDTQFCSVGDDSRLCLWDARSKDGKVTSVQGAGAGVDLHCVDWNKFDEELLAVGCADGMVRVFDRRKLGTQGGTQGGGVESLWEVQGHREPVLSVQWSPGVPSVLASGAEDSVVNVWDISKSGGDTTGNTDSDPRSSGLLFKHIGHRDKVVDLNWNAEDPWSIVSVSDDGNTTGGSTLQMWRISELVYRSEEELLAETEKHRSFILEH